MAHPRIVCLAGAGSQSGRAWEVFEGLIHYLITVGGYHRADFIEASYRVGPDGAPLPYRAVDSTRPLEVATANVARALEWLRRERPGRLHLIGWSLGGVVFFDAIAALVRADPSWTADLGALVTLSSPLLGSDLDGLELVGDLAVGPVGADLARRAADPEERARVQRDAARLRAAGVRLLTLAAEDDAVVPPEEAVLPGSGETPGALIFRPRRRAGAPPLESFLGHGALPHDPICWPCILAALGPAEG